MTWSVATRPTSPLGTPTPLCFSWSPETLQADSHLKAFALAVPSAWNTLFQALCLDGSFISFKSILKCHLVKEAFLDQPV